MIRRAEIEAAPENVETFLRGLERAGIRLSLESDGTSIVIDGPESRLVLRRRS